MGSFAPAYQQISNDLWLNAVFGDIVSRTSSNRSSSIGRRSNSFRSWHTAQNFPRDVTERDSTSSVSSPARTYYEGDYKANETFDTPDLLLKPSNRPSRSKLPPPMVGDSRSPSKISELDSESSNHSERSHSAPLRHQRKPGLRSRNTDTRFLPPLERRLSDVPEFAGFDSHPAVRPLESRATLGEAAGPHKDDESVQYPGPLTLTPILIGICLSVFIISLDRNIITTVKYLLPECLEEFC